jgi:hypothetical protein
MNMRSDIMAQLRFVGKVSDIDDRKIIYTPKEFHKAAEKLQGKQVRITIDDEIIA